MQRSCNRKKISHGEKTTDIAKQVRINQWAADIHECKARPKNVTVNDWCESHGITKATYYWRLNAVRKACIESVETRTDIGESSPAFVELKPPARHQAALLRFLSILEKQQSICRKTYPMSF